MAHNIDMSNGRANMAYVGAKPWHGLGSELPEGASIDEWRVAAGLDWEVKRAEVRYTTDDGAEMNAPRRHVLYRSDTGAALGIVAPKFKPVQPAEVLEFYRDLVAEQGFQLETAGSLKGGSMYWALAKTGLEFNAGGGRSKDKMMSYVLLATANDGTLATTATATSVRVVCWNTLSYSVAQAERDGSAVKVPHSQHFDHQATKIELGLVKDAWEHFEEQVDCLTLKNVTNAEAAHFFLGLFKDEDEIDLNDLHLTPTVKRLMDVYENAPGQHTKSADGTAWGLVNAVTRYADHERKSKSDDTRLRSAWFGPMSNLKHKAFNKALELAGYEAA